MVALSLVVNAMQRHGTGVQVEITGEMTRREDSSAISIGPNR